MRLPFSERREPSSYAEGARDVVVSAEEHQLLAVLIDVPCGGRGELGELPQRQLLCSSRSRLVSYFTAMYNPARSPPTHSTHPAEAVRQTPPNVAGLLASGAPTLSAPDSTLFR